jgi:hypothetical protein
MVKKPYEKVLIELNQDYNAEELNEFLSEEGETKIKIFINNKNTKYGFELEKGRKFDINKFNQVKSQEYVKKISF